jgi:hypothetical protein
MLARTRILSPAFAVAVLFGHATSPAAAQTESRDTATAAAPAPTTTPATTPSSAAAPSVYRLAQVGGKALPVEVEKGWRCREDVTAGTLTLGNDGRWVLETEKRETCGDRTREELESDDGRYKAEGQTLRFFDEDGEQNSKDWSIGKDIDLDDLTTGSIAGDGTLTVQLADEQTTLVFRR